MRLPLGGPLVFLSCMRLSLRKILLIASTITNWDQEAMVVAFYWRLMDILLGADTSQNCWLNIFSRVSINSPLLFSLNYYNCSAVRFVQRICRSISMPLQQKTFSGFLM